MKILLVEDNLGDARLLREMFSEKGAHNTELTHVECMSEAEKHLANRVVDIILLDLGLPDARGLEAVRRAHAAAPGVPLVVLTGLDDEVLAGQALHEGAQDYLIKGQIETAWNSSLASTLDDEASSQARAFVTDDLREGAAAFVQKRPTRFTGR